MVVHILFNSGNLPPRRLDQSVPIHHVDLSSYVENELSMKIMLTWCLGKCSYQRSRCLKHLMMRFLLLLSLSEGQEDGVPGIKACINPIIVGVNSSVLPDHCLVKCPAMFLKTYQKSWKYWLSSENCQRRIKSFTNFHWLKSTPPPSIFFFANFVINIFTHTVMNLEG